MSIDQLRIVYKELLHSASEQVNIVEAFVREHFADLGPMPLVVRGHNYDLVVKILEPTQRLKVIIPVDPAVRKTDRADNVELVEFLVAVHAVAPHIDDDHVLVRQIQKLLQGLVGYRGGR